MTDRICAKCGQHYSPSQDRNKGQGRKYCSNRCRYASRRVGKKTVKKHCPVCSKTFTVEWRRRKVQIWCSETCSGIGHRVTKRPTLAQLMDLLERCTFRQIGSMYGVTWGTVRSWIIRAGGTIPPRAELYRIRTERARAEAAHDKAIRKGEARRVYHKMGPGVE